MTTVVPDAVVGVLLCSGALTPEGWMDAITHPTLTLAAVWVYLLLYVVAFGLLFPSAVGAAHRVRRPVAQIVGWAGFIVYQGFLFVFIR